MGSKKTAQTSTNTYQYMQAPTNPHFAQAEALIDGYDGGAAGIREGHARNINTINESGNDVFGANQSPEMRDRVKAARLFRNNTDLGRNLADAKQNEIAYKNAGYMSLGGATAPQLVQTGGTANTTQSGGVMAGMAQSLAGGIGSGIAA